MRARRTALVLGCLVFVACTSPSRADAFVYWGDGVGNTIGRANLNGSGVDPNFITDVVQGPRGLAVDGAHIYWGNRNEDTIGRANLDGSGVNQQFITGADDPNGVAVDAAHVYWVNSDTDAIGRANLNGSNPDQDFISTTSNLTGVAVDAEHVYWADATTTAIGRANLNGSLPDPTFIDADGPAGVAVDAAHVYWGNFTNPGTSGSIGRADIDGSGPDQTFIPNGSAVNPTAVAVDAAHLYWTNAGLPNTIGRASLNASGPNHDFITGLSFLAGLAVDPLSVPSCQSASAFTEYATPVPLALSCTSGGGRRSFSIASQPAHGEIFALNTSAGKVTYTPEAGFHGTDSFTFRVRNPGAASNTAKATVQVAEASNAFTIGDADRNKKKGTAELSIEVPGAGDVDLAETRKLKGAAETAEAPGDVTLPIKSRGKARKRLKAKGKAKVTAEVTFAPVGGGPSSQSESVKLVKK